MADALALVPSEVRQPPTIPYAWDYGKSVTRSREVFLNWKKVTADLLDEMYTANNLLSRPGRPWGEKTWASWCADVGIPKSTANRWLAIFRLTGSNGSVNPALFSSESTNWFTPAHIIDRTQKLLGEIDLDPCSDADGNVPARERFVDGGLEQSWSGRVYMNPPYGREIGDWVTKLSGAFYSGEVTEAIALVPARTDTEWFRTFRDAPICFMRGRLRFSGYPSGAPFPSAAAYFGDRLDDFRAAFDDIGDIWVRVKDA